MKDRLLRVQAELGRLSYDELNVLYYLLKSWMNLLYDKRGKPLLEKAVSDNPDLQHFVHTLLDTDLDEESLLLILQSVALLRDALAPVPYIRGGEGHVQLKFIRGRGPYAYLRVWASGGDWDRKKSILRNVYLGKDLATAIVRGIITEKEVLEAFHDDRIDEMKEEIKQRLKKP